MVSNPVSITFTLDLEDHWYARDRDRFRRPAEALLAFTRERNIRGTIFVVGELVSRCPDLIQAFAASGHEIGLHGWTHTPLPEMSPAALEREIAQGQAALEDLVQQPVRGFRAPCFSLTDASRAAIGVLADLGFSYSSSVLPARNPQFGWPACPAAPFRWPEGIVELPVPVARLGRRALPFLGGLYLRLLPMRAVEFALRRADATAVLWSYCHPYDLDADEPFETIPQFGWMQSRFFWARRAGMLAKLDRLLRGRSAPPLGERVAAGLSLRAKAPSA